MRDTEAFLLLTVVRPNKRSTQRLNADILLRAANLWRLDRLTHHFILTMAASPVQLLCNRPVVGHMSLRWLRSRSKAISMGFWNLVCSIALEWALPVWYR